LKLIYFARVREIIGKSEEEINLPSDINKVDDLLKYLITIGDEYSSALSDFDSIHIACDEKHVDKNFNINNIKEIAIFPPVTGG
jgi:molybdopterin synthase sulfur carrier subunit|tara:strand:- start:565 stop:816 length:252 start_codon:yes stop_codon:yes gene_type:complete